MGSGRGTPGGGRSLPEPVPGHPFGPQRHPGQNKSSAVSRPHLERLWGTPGPGSGPAPAGTSWDSPQEVLGRRRMGS